MTGVRESLYCRKNKSSAFGILLNVILVLLVLILAGEIIFGRIYTGVYVIDRSMTPTLNGAAVIRYEDKPVTDANGNTYYVRTPVADNSGDYIYIKKGARPTYNDIVVVVRETVNEHGQKEKSNIIKRVIAMGGDKVSLDRGVLYVNEKEQDQIYLDPHRNNPDNEKNTFPEHIVEKDCLFLMGDNRNESLDSRDMGDYPESDVLGVVPKWSLKFKKISTAWYKFFRFTLRRKTTTA